MLSFTYGALGKSLAVSDMQDDGHNPKVPGLGCMFLLPNPVSPPRSLPPGTWNSARQVLSALSFPGGQTRVSHKSPGCLLSLKSQKSVSRAGTAMVHHRWHQRLPQIDPLTHLYRQPLPWILILSFPFYRFSKHLCILKGCKEYTESLVFEFYKNGIWGVYIYLTLYSL